MITLITKLTTSVFILAMLVLPTVTLAETDNQAKLTDLMKQVETLKQILADRQQTVENGNANSGECLNLSKTFKVGDIDSSSNQEIEKLQSWLKGAGFYAFPRATGFFGNITKEAVIKFQTKYGLTETAGTGVVGPNTQGKLRAVSCAGAEATINPQHLPSGQINIAYNVTLSVTGSTGSNGAFSLTDGRLPQGVRLVGNTLVGTPTQAGVYRFVISTTTNLGQNLTRNYLLIINDADGMLFGA